MAVDGMRVIEQKDAEIKRLTATLKRRDKTIERLRAELAAMKAEMDYALHGDTGPGGADEGNR